MPHEILGNHAAFDLPTWHGVGVYVGEKGFKDSAHVIEAAGLPDYACRPMTYTDGEGHTQSYPEQFVITRPKFPEESYPGPEVPMGKCTNVYELLQPKDAFAPFDPLVEAGLASYTAAGLLRNGGLMWIAAKLDMARVGKRIVRDKDGNEREDVVDLYLMLTAGFTGKHGCRMNASKIRTVCQNTLNEAVSSGSNSAWIHNINVKVNLEKAKENLAEMHSGFKEVVECYNMMAKKVVTPAIETQVFDAIYPPDQLIGERHYVSQNKVNEMKRLASEGLGNGDGTVWSLFNGITAYLDHHIERKNETAAQVLESSWYGKRGETREAAFEACMKAVA